MVRFARAAFVLALLLAPAAVSAQPRLARVEIAAQGLGINAPLMRQALQPRVQAALAANPLPDFGPGSRVVIRITSIFFNSAVPSGGNSGFFDNLGDSTDDSMEGDIIVLGANGRVVAQTRLLVHSPITHAGAWYAQGYGERRIEQLAEVFAYWLPRKLAGRV